MPRLAFCLEAQQMIDRACPLAFIVVTAFASGLIWVYSMLAYLPIR